MRRSKSEKGGNYDARSRGGLCGAQRFSRYRPSQLGISPQKVASERPISAKANSSQIARAKPLLSQAQGRNTFLEVWHDWWLLVPLAERSLKMPILSYDDTRRNPEHGVDQRGLISGIYSRMDFAPGSQLAKAAKRRKDLDCAAFRHVAAIQEHPETGQPRQFPKIKRIAREDRKQFEASEKARRFAECCAALKS